MSWVRSRSKLGSYLALFALAFQLAISFGHVHLDHTTPVSAGATALASTQASADDLNAPSSPAGREDVADDCCPICTLIHLAGVIVPAETPALPLPSMFGHLGLAAAVAFGLAASQSTFSKHAPLPSPDIDPAAAGVAPARLRRCCTRRCFPHGIR
jgi:hypothetical protein